MVLNLGCKNKKMEGHKALNLGYKNKKNMEGHKSFWSTGHSAAVISPSLDLLFIQSHQTLLGVNKTLRELRNTDVSAS